MTYRNKLLLRRALIILAIAAAVVALLLLIGFTYLGRYVVYTEDGAYFSFHSQAPAPSQAAVAAQPSDFELITGSPISANDVVGETGIHLEDTEVSGVLVDYDTLKEGTDLNSVELSAAGNNTLVLEMKAANQDLLNTPAISNLISRAKSQDTWLVAILSCLADSQYALDHPELALRINGGAYWSSSGGSYWLDPGHPDTISYLTGMIRTLADMGFNEVILNNFYMPTSSSVVYDFGEKTAEDISADAFFTLQENTVEMCKLGLLIEDPYEGHQLSDVADRLYVCFEEGSSVRRYAESHADQYLVFITESHDTRFDDYGKVESSGSFTSEAIPDGTEVLPEEGAEETPEEETPEEEPEEAPEEEPDNEEEELEDEG